MPPRTSASQHDFSSSACFPIPLPKPGVQLSLRPAFPLSVHLGLVGMTGEAQRPEIVQTVGLHGPLVETVRANMVYLGGVRRYRLTT